MAENIGPKIGIEGEAAFKQSLKNIVQQTKALDAELDRKSTRLNSSH